MSVALHTLGHTLAHTVYRLHLYFMHIQKPFSMLSLQLQESLAHAHTFT